MKRFKFIITFLVLCLNAFPQNIKSDLDAKVYVDLLTELGIDSTTNVYYRSSVKIFQGLNLKSKGFQWYHKRDVEDMNTFLSSINTGKLREKELKKQIGIYRFIRDTNNDGKFSSLPFLTLSPIVYSSEHELALCGVRNWQNNEASSETIYLLKKENNTWKIAKFLLVKIS